MTMLGRWNPVGEGSSLVITSESAFPRPLLPGLCVFRTFALMLVVVFPQFLYSLDPPENDLVVKVQSVNAGGWDDALLCCFKGLGLLPECSVLPLCQLPSLDPANTWVDGWIVIFANISRSHQYADLQSADLTGRRAADKFLLPGATTGI